MQKLRSYINEHKNNIKPEDDDMNENAQLAIFFLLLITSFLIAVVLPELTINNIIFTLVPIAFAVMIIRRPPK